MQDGYVMVIAYKYISFIACILVIYFTCTYLALVFIHVQINGKYTRNYSLIHPSYSFIGVKSWERLTKGRQATIFIFPKSYTKAIT